MGFVHVPDRDPIRADCNVLKFGSPLYVWVTTRK